MIEAGVDEIDILVGRRCAPAAHDVEGSFGSLGAGKDVGRAAKDGRAAPSRQKGSDQSRGSERQFPDGARLDA